MPSIKGPSSLYGESSTGLAVATRVGASKPEGERVSMELTGSATCLSGFTRICPVLAFLEHVLSQRLPYLRLTH